MKQEGIPETAFANIFETLRKRTRRYPRDETSSLVFKTTDICIIIESNFNAPLSCYINMATVKSEANHQYGDQRPFPAPGARFSKVPRTLHSFSDDQINIEIGAKLITKVKEAKSLGVIIEEYLSWSNHIGELSKKISSAIGAFKRIRPYISERTALQIYQPSILHHFDYCSSVWGDCNLTLSDKRQKLHNRAAGAITRSN